MPFNYHTPVAPIVLGIKLHTGTAVGRTGTQKESIYSVVESALVRKSDHPVLLVRPRDLPSPAALARLALSTNRFGVAPLLAYREGVA